MKRRTPIALLLSSLVVLGGCAHRKNDLPPLPPEATASGPYARIVQAQAAAHRVPAGLIAAIIAVESGGNPRARGPSGTYGLMQLKPETAAPYHVSDLFDPAQNISAGARYLRDLLDRFHDDVTLAVAAYHAGAGAVRRYGAVPPQSRDYVRRVLALYAQAPP